MVTRTRLYHDGTLVLEDFSVSDVSGHLADPASVVWLDLYRPGAAEFTMLGEDFGIHQYLARGRPALAGWGMASEPCSGLNWVHGSA
ncbi:hypothetical protein ACIOC2_29500, partial [Streptomyces sp. NPDC088337]